MEKEINSMSADDLLERAEERIEKIALRAKINEETGGLPVVNKGPPYDGDAERSVLATILARPNSRQDIQWLKPKHFYRLAHSRIYKAMLGLRRVTRYRVWDRLEDRGCFAECGGLAYFGEIESAPIAENISDPARLVFIDFVKRRLITLGAEAMGEIFDGRIKTAADISDLIAHLGTHGAEMLRQLEESGAGE